MSEAPTETPAGEAPKTAKPFPWRTALFVSLAMNLLLVGAGVGAYVSGLRLEKPPHEMRGEPRDARERGGFMRALSKEDRAAVGRIFRQTFVQTRDLRLASRSAREAVEALASAEAFDSEAMRAALARMRAADDALVEAMHNAFTDALAGLDGEARRAAVAALIRDRISAMGAGMGRRSREHGGEREPPHPPPEP